jgi:hypothetical protein
MLWILRAAVPVAIYELGDGTPRHHHAGSTDSIIYDDNDYHNGTHRWWVSESNVIKYCVDKRYKKKIVQDQMPRHKYIVFSSPSWNHNIVKHTVTSHCYTLIPRDISRSDEKPCYGIHMYYSKYSSCMLLARHRIIIIVIQYRSTYHRVICGD